MQPLVQGLVLRFRVSVSEFRGLGICTAGSGDKTTRRLGRLWISLLTMYMYIYI